MKKFRKSICRVPSILVFSAVGLFCSEPALSPPADTQPAVTKKDLEARIRYLSANQFKGRESGSPQALEAARYLGREMKRLGLFPAFPGENSRARAREAAPGLEGYLGPFDFNEGVRWEAEKNKITWEVGGSVATSAVIPLPFARAGRARGKFVLGGFCLRGGGWDDLKHFDPKGKIVLCLRYGPGGEDNKQYKKYINFKAKYDLMRKHGALGVVFLDTEGGKSPSPGWFDVSSDAGPPAVFLSYAIATGKLQWIAETEKTLRAGKNHEKVGADLDTVEIITDFEPGSMRGWNVGAYLRKPSPADRVVVLGAHFDHIGTGTFSSMGGVLARGQIHNGADDNASGTAVTLETAEFLAQKSERDKLPAGTNVLFLFFDAEERGLYGSADFVKNPPLDLKQINFMINLDMVGRHRPTDGISAQGAATADERLEKFARDAFKKSGLAGEIHFTKGGHGPSDHTSFYSKGISVLFVTTGSHKEYHKPDDDVELVNLDGTRGVAEMTREMIVAWAALKKPLVYRRARGGYSEHKMSYRVRLGIVPGSYGVGGGVTVGDVRSDAPIARSGITAGDVILSVGGHKLDGIRDLMDFLNKADAKTEYEVVYLREGKRLKTKTRLMAASDGN